MSRSKQMTRQFNGPIKPANKALAGKARQPTQAPTPAPTKDVVGKLLTKLNPPIITTTEEPRTVIYRGTKPIDHKTPRRKQK